MEERTYLFDERFAEAFLHSQSHAILGKRLKAFSSWHKLQLEWVNSKILLGGAGNWDLWLAVQVCQSEYPHPAKLPSAKMPGWWQLWWNICHIGTRWDREMVKFTKYLNDYYSPPKLWSSCATSKQRLAEAYEALYAITQDEGDLNKARGANAEAAMGEGADRQIDDSLEAVAYYCKSAGRSSKEAWNMGIGELYWMNTVFYQMEGGKSEIWTPTDQMRFERHLVKRAASIDAIAQEVLAEHPGISPELAHAKADVQYWSRVVSNVDERPKGYG